MKNNKDLLRIGVFTMEHSSWKLKLLWTRMAGFHFKNFIHYFENFHGQKNKAFLFKVVYSAWFQGL